MTLPLHLIPNVNYVGYSASSQQEPDNQDPGKAKSAPPAPPSPPATSDEKEKFKDALIISILNMQAQEKEDEQIAKIKAGFEKLKTEYQSAAPDKKTLYLEFNGIFNALKKILASHPARYQTLNAIEIDKDGLSLQNSYAPEKIRQDIAPFLDLLLYLTQEQKEDLCLEANQLFMRLSLPENFLGENIIKTLHAKQPEKDTEQLQKNLKKGMELFARVPYGNGYIAANGRLMNGRLDCLSYANIFVNLVTGTKNYTPELSGMTSPDLFISKSEYKAAGISQKPVIVKYPLSPEAAENLPRLLSLYGDFFVAQIYVNNLPYHVIMLYKESDIFKVTESDIGNKIVYGQPLTEWLEENASYTFLTINLINSSSFQPFARGKNASFTENLEGSLKKVKIK